MKYMGIAANSKNRTPKSPKYPNKAAQDAAMNHTALAGISYGQRQNM
tara:strand:- start:684 stop:824 length:141 start_codon:yes stop_codon:yes gene_type:complete